MLLTRLRRTTNDELLRSKVDEALRVYNEYLQSQGGEDGEQQQQPSMVNGTEKSEGQTASAETPAANEA